MRIVGGMHRGRTLVAPKGQSTRPTADRTRQAMFNVLEHAAWSPGLAGRRAIDLFAGAGALGLEALSRGAAFCLFVDGDAAARAAIRANIEALRLEDRARVAGVDATRLEAVPIGLNQPDRDKQALSQTFERFLIAKPVPTFAESALGAAAGPPFDLAFVDPPYGQGLAAAALAALAAGGWLGPDALIAVERGAGEAPLLASGYELLDARCWGAARVEFLKAR
jgi:16S rRNA (guanine966-N2)-methyltransferase